MFFNLLFAYEKKRLSENGTKDSGLMILLLKITKKPFLFGNKKRKKGVANFRFCLFYFLFTSTTAIAMTTMTTAATAT